MAATFEIEKSNDDKFFFRLRSSAGGILLTSETFTAKASAKNSIASVKTHAPTDKYYERATAVDGRFYFTLKASNGEKLGRSPLYERQNERDAAIETTKNEAPGAGLVDRA